MIYIERTNFNRFIAIPLIFPIIYCVAEVFSGIKNNDTPKIFIFSIIVMFSLMVIMVCVFSNLKLSFYNEYLTYDFKPFVIRTQKIKYNDITFYEIKKIDALSDFQGWGLRTSRIYGKGLITDTEIILILNVNGTIKSFSIKNEDKIRNLLQNIGLTNNGDK
ncbi:hypothetical protein [Flavobacterium sp.]|uniref:hypothetical protein n=1 Tax=Flavobacterium sp. TaxID=239 RepID=UPI0022C6C380|nr:hypothetical protein [Flavobacterium sp.]MCZ8228792.1 hypothetical protein [Flavobacterium sp.]